MAENEQTTEDEQAQTAPANNKKKWLIWGFIVLLLAGVSVAGTLYAIGFFNADKSSAANADQATAEQGDSAKKAPAIYYPLKPQFITSYDVHGRQRFLQLSITLMLRDPDVPNALQLYMPAIRNALIILFRGQQYQELQTPEGKELLRQQALLTVQQVLQKEIGKPGVEQVLFTNMVMQ